MLIDSMKVNSTCGEEPTVMTPWKKNFKIELAIEEWKKLIAKGLRRA